MNNQEAVKKTTVKSVSKSFFNDAIIITRYTQTIQFTTEGVIIGNRKPTRADSPQEVKRYGKLKKSTILSLRPIIKEEYGLDLEGSDLENFAYRLVGYFDVLAKAEQR